MIGAIARVMSKYECHTCSVKRMPSSTNPTNATPTKWRETTTRRVKSTNKIMIATPAARLIGSSAQESNASTKPWNGMPISWTSDTTLPSAIRRRR